MSIENPKFELPVESPESLSEYQRGILNSVGLENLEQLESEIEALEGWEKLEGETEEEYNTRQEAVEKYRDALDDIKLGRPRKEAEPYPEKGLTKEEAESLGQEFKKKESAEELAKRLEEEWEREKENG